MRLTYFILVFAISTFIFACNGTKKSQNSNESQSPFVVGFYNVENLFDTIDNPNKYDEDFTPAGKKNWTAKRYQVKLEKLSKVIAAIDTVQLPYAMGFCEIENKAVVEDLIQTETLKNGNYGIVHHESPDERGIDVAFIYQKDKIKIESSKAIQTPFAFDTKDKTRDILHVEATFKSSKETIHFFINHWPSRGGGREKSEPKRVAVANYLKAAIDKVIEKDPEAKIVCMGDFNDEPNNKSIIDALGAKSLDETVQANDLLNLAAKDFSLGLGSYHYWKENKWNMIDQAIINGNMYQDNEGLSLIDYKMHIFKPEWILHKGVPNKTYGKYYYGGYSDHLPVYLKFNQ